MGRLITPGYLGEVPVGEHIRCLFSTHDELGAPASLSAIPTDKLYVWNLSLAISVPLTSGITENLGVGANVHLVDVDPLDFGAAGDNVGEFALTLGDYVSGISSTLDSLICQWSLKQRAGVRAENFTRDLFVESDGTVYANLEAGDLAELMQIQAKTDLLPSVPANGVKKSTALADFPFVLRQLADPKLPATGITVLAQRSLDGGAFANCTNAVAEISGGAYKIALGTGDTNANRFVLLKFSGTGAITEFAIVLITP